MKIIIFADADGCARSIRRNYTKQAMDIVTERSQPHPGVLVIYELAD